MTTTMMDYVKDRVAAIDADPSELGVDGFPLPNSSTDTVRTIAAFRANVVASWFDPMTWDTGADSPYVFRARDLGKQLSILSARSQGDEKLAAARLQKGVEPKKAKLLGELLVSE